MFLILSLNGWKIQMIDVNVRDVFKTPLNIYDGVFCWNSYRLLVTF